MKLEFVPQMNPSDRRYDPMIECFNPQNNVFFYFPVEPFDPEENWKRFKFFYPNSTEKWDFIQACKEIDERIRNNNR